MHTSRRVAQPLIALFSIAVLLLPTRSSAVPTVQVVMSGLDNPRGLALGPEGGLYVAEAGRGGAGPCQTLRGALQCYGPSGAVSRLWGGRQERVVTGLPSQADPTGQAIGPQDISFQGRGGAYITVGFGGNPALRSGFGDAGALFGSLIHAPASGKWRAVSDLSAYEVAHNPAGGPIDSNPFGVVAGPAKQVVSDAGGNDLLQVDANGTISTLATLRSRPTAPTDSVPTGLTLGPDGAYYVGELTGFPFNDGASQVYKIVPGQAPQVVLTGFKTILDLAFGPDGSLYVLEFASGATGLGGPGRLLHVASNGARTTVVGGLDHPTSVLIDEDGTIFVTNHGITPGAGEVLKIQF